MSNFNSEQGYSVACIYTKQATANSGIEAKRGTCERGTCEIKLKATFFLKALGRGLYESCLELVAHIEYYSQQAGSMGQNTKRIQIWKVRCRNP